MQLRDDGPVLVVGPGAVGLLVAVRLAAAGTDVVLAARDAAGAKSLHAGLQATGPDGAVVKATVPVVTRPADVPQAPRLLVLATKCADAPHALQSWLPVLGEDTPVVAMQNGVLGDVLRPLAGDRFLDCTVSFPATLAAPGQSRQTGPGGLHIGPWPRAGPRDDPAVVQAVARILCDAAPVAGSGNMAGVKWTKLAINSCITGLGVLCGEELGTLLGDPRARAAFLRVAEEAYVAGRADDIHFEPLAGFRPGLFGRALPGRDLLLRALGRKYRRHRSSSLQSLDRGRRTEIDFLNGHIVTTARRHGLDAPVNAAIVHLVHAVEEGRTKPGLAHLDALPL